MARIVYTNPVLIEKMMFSSDVKIKEHYNTALQQQLARRGGCSRNLGFSKVRVKMCCNLQEILLRTRYAGANNNYYIDILRCFKYFRSLVPLNKTRKNDLQIDGVRLAQRQISRCNFPESGDITSSVVA